MSVRRYQRQKRFTDYLVGPVPKEAFCFGVPALDDAIGSLNPKSIPGAIDDCCKYLLIGFEAF